MYRHKSPTPPPKKNDKKYHYTDIKLPKSLFLFTPFYGISLITGTSLKTAANHFHSGNFIAMSVEKIPHFVGYFFFYLDFFIVAVAKFKSYNVDGSSLLL